VHPLWEQGKKWSKERPNLVFASTGQGINADALIISVHKNYADFVKFYQEFRRDWGKYLEEFKIFLISVSGSVIMKKFSFNYLIDACKKEKSE
jgi:hypothetical protein